jgi:hypothetical protein
MMVKYLAAGWLGVCHSCGVNKEIAMAYVYAERNTGVSVMGVIYVLIGIYMAATRGYLVFTSLSDILSALLAVVAWPLLLFGVNLHIALGA